MKKPHRAKGNNKNFLLSKTEVKTTFSRAKTELTEGKEKSPEHEVAEHRINGFLTKHRSWRLEHCQHAHLVLKVSLRSGSWSRSKQSGITNEKLGRIYWKKGDAGENNLA